MFDNEMLEVQSTRETLFLRLKCVCVCVCCARARCVCVTFVRVCVCVLRVFCVSVCVCVCCARVVLCVCGVCVRGALQASARPNDQIHTQNMVYLSVLFNFVLSCVLFYSILSYVYKHKNACTLVHLQIDVLYLFNEIFI